MFLILSYHKVTARIFKRFSSLWQNIGQNYRLALILGFIAWTQNIEYDSKDKQYDKWMSRTSLSTKSTLLIISGSNIIKTLK